MTGKHILLSTGMALLFSLAACSPPVAPEGSQATAPDITSTPETSPPLASLEIDGLPQTAGLGSYCWNYETADGGVGACLDTVGLPTPRDPLISRSSVTARFTVPVDEPPELLQLSVFQALDEYEVKMDGLPAAFRYWMPGEGVNLALTPKASQDINIDLEPGLYVFNVFVSWKIKGDASYGFLVEVR